MDAGDGGASSLFGPQLSYLHPNQAANARKKSRSLPVGKQGPSSALDSQAIFAAFRREEAGGEAPMCREQPIQESSISSDTSCSSLEFHRPGSWDSILSASKPLWLSPSNFRRAHSASPAGAGIRSSTESLQSRKERLEAVKARVEAEHQRYGAGSSSSSSEDDVVEGPKLIRYHSDESLHRSSRSRAARTERYLKRKSQEETVLKKAPATKTQSCVDVSARKPPNGRQWHANPCWPGTEDNLNDSSQSSYHSAQENHIAFVRSQSQPAKPKVGLQIRKCSNLLGQRARPGGNEDHHHHLPMNPLSVSTSLMPSCGRQHHLHLHPQQSPQDSGVSSQSLASSPSLGRAPTPPPRSPLPRNVMDGTHFDFHFHQGYPRPLSNSQAHLHQRSTSCSTETVQDSGLYSHSPTLTLASDASSGRTSPWQLGLRGAVRDGFHKPKQTVPMQNPTLLTRPLSVYSSTDFGSSVRQFSQKPWSGSVVYSYTDQAPFHNHIASYQSHRHHPQQQSHNSSMSDSQLEAINKVGLPQTTLTDISTSITDSSDARTRWPLVPTRSAPQRKATGISSASPRSQKNGIHELNQNEPVNRRPFARPISMLENWETRSERRTLGVVPPVPPTRKSSSTLSLDTTKKCIEDFVLREKQRRCSDNLENALMELEDIYQSLKLNDEDLLDRAERRDLPTEHQLKRPNMYRRGSASLGETEPLGGFPLTRSCSDSLYPTLTKRCFVRVQDGHVCFHHPQPTRTPSYRRSAVPDKTTDDLAYRKLQKSTTNKVLPSKDGKSVGSYLLCNPAFTPSIAVEDPFKLPLGPREPDVVQDDLSYRIYRQSDGAKVQSPHPPFGIPLRPLSQSSESDYLNARPSDMPRPVLHRRGRPDVVRDDMAFRNLRKESSPPRTEEEDKKSRCALEGWLDRKRLRATRSLSANVGQMMDITGDHEKAQSMSDLIQALERESSKWEMLTDALLRESAADQSASTETLTESRVNLASSSRYQGHSVGTTSTPSSPPPPPSRRCARPAHHSFWSDSEVRSKKKPIPLDEGQLDDLLSALDRDTKNTFSGNGHVSKEGSTARTLSGELHGLSVTA